MKAMILAGGLSTRLYPLTKQVPKPLVPLAGTANAVHLIEYLKTAGVTDLAINVFYLADAITEALGDGSRFGVRLQYLHEPVLMGSAGALKPLEWFFDDGDFLVVGCDDITNVELDELLAFHKEKKAIATIALVERDEVDQYGVVVVDDESRVIGFQEKPAKGTERSKLVNTGIYVFSPEIFSHIPAETFYDFGKQVFPALQQDAAAFYGFDARDAYWCDIGTPGEYRRASFDVVNGVFTPASSRGRGIDPSAVVAPTAAIDANVFIGERAEIADGVRIVGPAVIGNDVRVFEQATIANTIVWDGAEIGAGAQVRDSIVGLRYVVDGESILESAIVANEPVPAP